MTVISFSNKEKNEFFENTFVVLLLCAHLVIIIAVFLMCLVPPFMRDELTHHLAIPKLWISRGGIYQIPDLVSSYYPMNIDLLYTIPLYFKYDSLPKVIHFIFGLFSTALVYNYLKSKTKVCFALIGSLLFLSTPVILKLSVSAYVDLGLVFFSMSAIFFLFKWRNDSKRLKYFYLSAILCGLGLGSKYNGLIVLFILTMFVPFLYLHTKTTSFKHQLKAVNFAFLYCLISLFIFSPWMIKNYIWTGNPVYPLYQNKISQKSESVRFSIKPLLQRKLLYNENATETMLIPIRIFFEGKDDDPKYFDGKLNPFLILLPIIPFLRKKWDRNLRQEQVLLGLFSIIFILFVFFSTDMRIRYVAPILPLLAILSAFGLERLFFLIDGFKNLSFKRIARTALSLVLLWGFTMNCSYLIHLFKDIEPLPVIRGDVTKEVYLEQRLPEYPTVQFANSVHKDGNKILGLFLGRKGYYFKSEVIFMINDFKELVNGEPLKKSLLSSLTDRKYTHLVIGINPFKEWVNKNFSKDMKIKISELFKKNVKLLYKKNGFAFYELI